MASARASSLWEGDSVAVALTPNWPGVITVIG